VILCSFPISASLSSSVDASSSALEISSFHLLRVTRKISKADDDASTRIFLFLHRFPLLSTHHHQPLCLSLSLSLSVRVTRKSSCPSYPGAQSVTYNSGFRLFSSSSFFSSPTATSHLSGGSLPPRPQPRHGIGRDKRGMICYSINSCQGRTYKITDWVVCKSRSVCAICLISFVAERSACHFHLSKAI
jgi:hypothetical protein